MAEPITGKFASADGLRERPYYIWEPAGAPKAIVQLSHGMCEYVLRYAPFGEHLAENGIVFAGNDHLGHGKSAEEDGSLGFIAEENGPDILVEDLHTLTGILKEKYPGVPVILLGHSMGSFVCRLYLASYAGELAGAIVMGTGGPDAPAGLGRFVASTIAVFRGVHHRSKFLRSLAFSGYNKRCAKEEGPNAWLSVDRDNVKKYDEDPLCGFLFTVGGYYDLFSMLGAVSTEEWAQSIPTDFPLLLVSGADDPVGGYGKGVAKVASMLAGAGARKMTVKLFQGDRHEILNETDRESVMAYIDGWISSVLDSAKEE